MPGFFKNRTRNTILSILFGGILTGVAIVLSFVYYSTLTTIVLTLYRFLFLPTLFNYGAKDLKFKGGRKL